MGCRATHRDGAGTPPGTPRPPAVAGSLATAALALALSVGGLQAQGFSVNEHGTCQMGRAGAGTASPCADGSAVLFNPAALAGTDGATVSAGAMVLAAFGEFTSDYPGETTELDNDPIPVPHLYATWGATDRLGVGLGVFVPYGLETKWPTDFEGRFLGYDNKLQSIYVQPTLAYELNDVISVGGGPTYVVGAVELNQRLDLSTQTVPSDAVPTGTTFGQLGVPHHTDFADANLDASGATGVGANVGVQIRPADWVRVGARYLSQVTLEYEGDATFEQVETGLTLAAGNPFGLPAGTSMDEVVAGSFSSSGALQDQVVRTEITMPDQLQAGVAVDATDRVTVMADYHWMDWSDFDAIPLDFEVARDDEQVEDYEDTHAVRLGLEAEATSDVTVRGGWIYHDAAAPDRTVTPLLPEAARHEITGGLGWSISPSFTVDLAYQFIAQQDRRGRVTDSAPGTSPTTALNSGLYEFGAHLVSSTFTYTF